MYHLIKYPHERIEGLLSYVSFHTIYPAGTLFFDLSFF